MRAIAIAVVIWSRAAQADFDPEWRDGCPAGDLTRKPDLEVSPLDLPRPYPGTDPRRTSAMPQPDSSLAPNQIGGDAALGHFASARDGVPAARILRTDLRAHVDVLSAGSFDLGGTVIASQLWMDEGPTRFSRFGNLVLEPHVRWMWNGSGSTRLDAFGPTPATVRNGIGLQLIASIPDDENHLTILEKTALWRRSGFDGYQISPRPTLGLAFETRTEGVGCYAPFIHLRLSGTVTEIDDAANPMHRQAALLAPQTLTLGFAASGHITVALQYGLLVSFGIDDERRLTQLALGATAIHRFRIAGQLAYPWFEIEVHLDGYTGSSLYDGRMFGLTYNQHWGK